MLQLATCPSCSRQISVPPAVDTAVQVRCPLCRAEYALEDALNYQPPQFELVGAASGSLPSGSLLSGAMSAATGPWDEPADNGPASAESDEIVDLKFDDDLPLPSAPAAMSKPSSKSPSIGDARLADEELLDSESGDSISWDEPAPAGEAAKSGDIDFGDEPLDLDMEFKDSGAAGTFGVGEETPDMDLRDEHSLLGAHPMVASGGTTSDDADLAMSDDPFASAEAPDEMNSEIGSELGDDPFTKEDDFAVDFDAAGETSEMAAGDGDDPFQVDDEFKTDDESAPVNFDEPAMAGAVAAGADPDAKPDTKSSKKSRAKAALGEGHVGLPPARETKRKFGIMGIIALAGLIGIPLVIAVSIYVFNKAPFGLANILPEAILPDALKPSKQFAKAPVNPGTTPTPDPNAVDPNNPTPADPSNTTPPADPFKDPMTPDPGTVVPDPANTDPNADPTKTPADPVQTDTMKPTIDPGTTIDPPTDPIDTAPKPPADPVKPVVDKKPADPGDDPFAEPKEPIVIKPDPTKVDDPLDPLAEPKTPAVEPPAPLVKNAPTVKESDVTAALADAGKGLDALKEAESEGVMDIRKQKLAYYVSMAQLGHLATFAGPSDKLQASVNELLGKLAGDTIRIEELAALGGYWAKNAKFRETNGGSPGVAITGIVQEVSEQGKLWQTKLLTMGKPTEFVVLSATKPKAEEKTPVLILGTIVASPKENLTGYDGDAAEVIWTAKMFDAQEKTDALEVKAAVAEPPKKEPAKPDPSKPEPAQPKPTFDDPFAPTEEEMTEDKPAPKEPAPKKPAAADGDIFGDPAAPAPAPADELKAPESKPAVPADDKQDDFPLPDETAPDAAFDQK